MGNFKLCGVLLAYAQDGMAQMLKKSMGWNFAPDALGARITREIVELVLAEQIRPVIGRVVALEELAAAIDAMANRQTVGRTIVKLY
jgi:NADPH2:quinone reductase